MTGGLESGRKLPYWALGVLFFFFDGFLRGLGTQDRI